MARCVRLHRGPEAYEGDLEAAEQVVLRRSALALALALALRGCAQCWGTGCVDGEKEREQRAGRLHESALRQAARARIDLCHKLDPIVVDKSI